MPSLRRRFLSGTRILLGLQVLTSGLVLASWLGVVSVSDGLRDLSGWRLNVLAYGSAVREQYVHQAHSFVEGGSGHLDHYGHSADDAAARLAALDNIPFDDITPIRAELQRDQTDFSGWFDSVARPALIRGVDRPEAVALHEEAEDRIVKIEADTSRLLDAVERHQAEAQARLETALRRAVLASVVLAGLGGLLQVGIARRLAGAVLQPLAGLSEVATRFGRGEREARAPEAGDEEVNALAHSFNAMFDAVVRSEDRRVRAERLAALGELSAAIAHELNNPLTVILGTATEPEVRAEAEHASRVVRGLLGFARPGEEPKGPVDLAALTAEAVARHGPWADARDVALDLAPSEPIAMLTSPAAARQILDNLLRNAIEAAPAGSTIEVALDAEGLSVADRGPGLPESLRGRLYEPFATGRAGGTGLGLAICQRIARAQGGQISHEDRAGGGCVARWRLGRVG